MARQRERNPRVLGPYADRDGFRVIHVKRGGERDSFCFETAKEAMRAVRALRVEIERPDKVLKDALDDYEMYMRDDKGNRLGSAKQTQHKLRRFFGDVEVLVGDLDADRCAKLYEALRAAKKKDGKPLSVDYHRNALAEARTFLKWCVTKKRWLARNPLEGVEGVGRRRHGKPQLRIDEARKWLAKATELADRGEGGAVAAMMTLLMGMRCMEVMSRVVRDIDDDGRLLWIPDSKTEKGKRTLVIPDSLQPYLQRLAEGKQGNEPIFGAHDRAWPRLWVKKICHAARVPVVTAHGQRGLHSTLAVEAGVTARVVADALGHESFKTTAQSYAKPEAISKAKQARVFKVLAGGKASNGTHGTR